MIQVFEPEEVASNRGKAGLIIDSVTKKIVDRSIAVSTAVDNAVVTAVVDKKNYKNEIITLYKKYTNNDWDEKAEKFYKTIKHLKPEIVESAFIVGILKEKRNDKHISDFKNLFKELDNELPKAYIGHLRVIWKEFQIK
jgi:hypothetical protein